MESRNSSRCEVDRGDLISRQAPARLGRQRPHIHLAWCLAVDAHSGIDQTAPATLAYLVHDQSDRRAKLLVGSLRRPRERGAAIGRSQLSPDEPFHSIIFSIGTTRIADAPAALRFCSVSQKTDSWHTA